MRFGFEVDASADFFSDFPSAGEAINAPATKQLMKIDPLGFMILSSLIFPFYRALPQGFAVRKRERPADFHLRTRACTFDS
jgi:hypothetical protein